MNINEPCLSMVNPKLLLLIFSSLHDALEITRLINISTRNAVCVITGRHLRSSSQIHRRLNRLLHISSLEHGHHFQVATFIFAVRQRSGECYVFTRVCVWLSTGGPCTGPRPCPLEGPSPCTGPWDMFKLVQL